MSDKRPLTSQEAEGQCPGLRALSRPGKQPFLNCQLGRVQVEPIEVVTRIESEDFSQMLYVKIFHLIGFGPTWRAAIAMVKEKESGLVRGPGLQCL